MEKNAHFQVKLPAKYAIIYTSGLVHEKIGVWIKAIPNSIRNGNSQLG